MHLRRHQTNRELTLRARGVMAFVAISGTLLAGLTALAAPVAADTNCPTASAGLSGAGTSGVPYLIQSQADLQLVKTNTAYRSGFFQQTQNIDMQVTPGTDCVWDAGINSTFSGTYDGGGFEISGLAIEPSSSVLAGLFERVTGTIQNLGFTGDVTGLSTSSLTAYVGGLVGWLEGGTVDNSYATGNVSSGARDNNYPGAGGLVGFVDEGTVTNSYATGNVSAVRRAGGLVGITGGTSGNEAVISQSYATGDVTVDFHYVGGFAASLRYATVSQSYATGNVTANGTGSQDHVAGFAGVITLSSVTDSYATGGVAGGSIQVGGFGGDVGTDTFVNTVLTRVYSLSLSGITPLSGASQTGGFIGYLGTGRQINKAFFNNETSTFGDNAAVNGGTNSDVKGRSTSELTSFETFTDATAGWDWNSGGSTVIADGYDPTYTWGMCSAVNSGYPFLTAFYSSDPCTGSSPTPSSGGSAARPMTFSYYLPDGQQCTSISPQVVVNRTRVTLPGADAECRTPGATISGWRIAGQDWAFTPGFSVYVVASQRFTAVLNEPTVSVVLDANVKALDPCMAMVDGVETDLAAGDRTQTLHLDRPDMDEYSPGDRPSLATYPAPGTAPCTPPGYELISWNTRGDGTGITIAPGTPFDPAINDDDPNSDRNTVRFYAMWEEKQKVVSTSASAFFAEESSEFTQLGRKKLDFLVTSIPATATNVTVSVIGSSVSSGTSEGNQRLAKQRADALAREIRSLGVTGDYVITTADTAMRAWAGGKQVPSPQSASDPQVSADGKPLSTVTITYRSR